MMIQWILLLMAPILAMVGIMGFLIPNRFVDGGVTGLAMLLAEVFHWPLWILLILINLPFILAGAYWIQYKVAVRGVIAITLLVGLVAFINLPALTTDPLLAAVFGGIFLGGGIGLAIRGGGVLDGTEVASIILSHRSAFSIGDFILAFNIILFSASALVLGVERAMYSILTYIAASKTIDFLVYGLDEHVAFQVVSSESEAIRKAIVENLGKGVTLIESAGGFSKNQFHIVYCVVNRFEISKLKRLVTEIDPKAFINMHRISQTVGGWALTRNHLHDGK